MTICLWTRNTEFVLFTQRAALVVKRKRMKEVSIKVEMTVPDDFDTNQFCLATVSGDYPELAEEFCRSVASKTSVIWKKKKNVVVIAFGWDAKTS